MPSIKCQVRECHYNKNVMCDAPMIQVDHNGVPKTENSQQTQCQTFKPEQF